MGREENPDTYAHTISDSCQQTSYRKDKNGKKDHKLHEKPTQLSNIE